MTTTTRAPSDAATSAANDLVDVFARLRRMMRAMPSDGLTAAQTSVLLRLDKDGASSTTVLAIAEGVRSQSMTATLNALDSLGLILRRPDPDDGRRQIVTLSRAGRARVSRDRAGRHAWLARAMDKRFSRAELRTVNEALALLGDLVRQ
jgi:DNA-binding MarR family transcriptional regulator